jgi:hypothetical protein
MTPSGIEPFNFGSIVPRSGSEDVTRVMFAT